jgi:hypothetical protein
MCLGGSSRPPPAQAPAPPPPPPMDAPASPAFNEAKTDAANADGRSSGQRAGRKSLRVDIQAPGTGGGNGLTIPT